MRLSWCAIAFFAVDSLGAALATTNAPRCSAYPKAQALVQQCSTGSAFCTSYLGRGPSTVHVTKTRTQTSILASTTTAVITDTISSTDATVTLITTTTTTSTTTTGGPYVTTVCNSNNKRAIQPQAYRPSCGVKGTNPPPSAGVSAACSCLIDQTSSSFVTTTITAYGTAVTTINSYTTSTDFQTATSFSTVDSTTTDTITMGTTGPPQTVTATVAAGNAVYTQYFIGTGVTENPNNYGNDYPNDYPPITTLIAQPSASGACALPLCANFALAGDESYLSFDLHYLVDEGMWQCIAYFDPNQDPGSFDQANGDVGDAYGYYTLD